ncbi:MAG: hypothetical protein Q9216_005135 [Gyalolechia sp. 2 TL-2023]
MLSYALNVNALIKYKSRERFEKVSTNSKIAQYQGMYDNGGWTLGESITEPWGFSCTFQRAGQAKDLPSKDLYAATLHALLHFSLQRYQSPAEIYTTRGPEPLGLVLVRAVPFVLPVASTLNAHIAWGLYRSIIAFNVPDNTRETVAKVAVHGLPVGDIDYLQLPQAPMVTSKRSGRTLANLTSASAMQMLSNIDDDLFQASMQPSNAPGYRLDWNIVPNGATIRRETAYDAVAYAVLWTAQFPESTELDGFRQLTVRGGSVTVRYMSFQLDRLSPMTLGFAATIAVLIPKYLEDLGHFREAIATVYTLDGRVCGQVGIWKQRMSGDRV